MLHDQLTLGSFISASCHRANLYHRFLHFVYCYDICYVISKRRISIDLQIFFYDDIQESVVISSCQLGNREIVVSNVD